MTRRFRLMLAGFGVIAVVAGACDLDETAGLSRDLGDPLLDITLGPSGDAVYPSHSHVINATRDTLTVTLRNLGPLPAGAVYQVYLVDSASAANNVKPVGGRLIRATRARRPVNRDTILTETVTDTVADAGAITAADTNVTFTLRITDPAIATSTHVVVGVAPAAQTSASSLSGTTRFGFLASRYHTGATYANGSSTFGSWAVANGARLPFIPSSATINGAFRGGTVRLNIRDLIRPPIGFRYAGWVIDARTGRSARLGGLLTPVPGNRSLDDADVGTDEFLTDVAMIEAQLRGDTATSGDIRWDDYSTIVLLIEPKGTAAPTAPGGAFVLGGPVPQSVASRAPGAGKVSGTVTGANAVGATVYLATPGNRNPLPGLVTNASATGTFLFRTVIVGQYRAYVIPRNTVTPTDSADITIGTRMIDGATVGDSVAISLEAP